MQLQFKYLNIYILSAMLGACGGGGGSSTESSNSSAPSDSSIVDEIIDFIGGVITPEEDQEQETVPVQESYPEPAKDVMDDALLGYYDYNALGNTRDIRVDLEGSFKAMVQFAQGHVVDPNGNEAKKMPRLTSEKEALLLVTPTLDMGDVTQLTAEIYQGGRLLRQIKLQDPTQIPASDQNKTDTRPRVSYSKRAWSARLNWDEVRPGLQIKIIDQQNRSGELFAEKIDFAAPGELVVNNIRVGMLTDYPKSNGHYMLLQPEKAGTDYFQTIPAAQMTVAKYDDMTLNRVMVSNGTIYDVASTSTGGDYAGDMREDVGKSTFSVGINLANWGITSASMASQSQPQLTQTVVVHHTRGNYANGVQGHGLSGGNGMLTLYDSVGNEFSHEIGHHYGLGHYPGQEGDNLFWAAHHADSGWGYIGYRNMMRGNLSWTATWKWDGSNGIPNFQNIFPYGKDAMSGGYADSTISRYTHYTGYSTFLKIQPHFDRYVWDETSPTGYKKWNKDTRQMEVAQPVMPNSTSPVWYQAKQNYPRPRIFGQPVLTILGGYDPVNQMGLLYPAARSNWGNVYDLPSANTALDQSACWLNIQYPNRVKNVALSPARLGSNANKLHVNLAISDQPQKVDLYCKQANANEKLLASIDIPHYTDVITPAVHIGKAEGYSALRKIELPTLEQELITQASNDVVSLKPATQLLYDAYKANKNELSALAVQQMDRYTQQQNTIYRLNRWMNVYQADLKANQPEALTALNHFIELLGLSKSDLNSNTSLIKNGTNCLKVEKLENGQYNTSISGSSGCSANASEQWVYDGLGRIQSRYAVGQCLTSTGGGAKIILTDCATDKDTQIWTMKLETTAITQSGQCFDLESGRLTNNRANLIRYACTGGGNQKWSNLTPNSSLILAYLKPQNLRLLVQ
ncbi:M66 family metalloprotease [Acinetobacter sp.]|uniref:M66 family metalloprotease n=1 Tax=Acinetobacter sp. TaxID=472 RepID=UPI0028965A2C|nr:M66 family metalloprotease [Acinetobacter sp.]